MTSLKITALALVAMLSAGCATTAASTASRLSASKVSTKGSISASTSKNTRSASTAPKQGSPKATRHRPSTALPMRRPTPTPQPSPTNSSPPPSATCSASSAQGSCGPYGNYPPITGTTSATNIGNNVWNPISGWAQTLYATNPGNWFVKAKLPAGNTAVVSYPSVGANYGTVNNTSTPLSHYSSIYSSFTENMHATSGTSAWAAYDIWLGDGTSSNWTHEVMIQHDFANNGPCTAAATATFGGSGGVPVQKWHLCTFGSELVWKLTGGNEPSGTVDVLAMLKWLVAHGYMPSNVGLWEIGYGWEICSTGGRNEDFQVTRFSIAVKS